MSILIDPARSTKSANSSRRKTIRNFGEGILEPDPDRNDLDRAWDSGFDLGIQGIAALAPPEWPEMVRESWITGYMAGASRMIADGEGGEL